MTGLATTLGYFSTILEEAIDWVGSLLTTIAGNDILFICVVGLPVIGFGVGLLSRLFRVN